MTITCIVHGAKKIKAKHLAFIDACKQDNRLVINVQTTQYPNHAFEIAQSAKQNSELIIILGGDGTINEVINGLCSAPGHNPKLFILPNGNGNDFVRNFPTPNLKRLQPEDLIAHPTQEVLIPYLKTHENKKYFINIADIGFGGHVVKNLNDYRKKYGHGFSYLLAILRTFKNHKAQSFSVEFNGQKKSQLYFMLAICHGSAFGKGLFIAPQKHPTQTHFQLVCLGEVSVWDYLKHLPSLYRGARISHPEISYFETDKIIITSNGLTVHSETDGEYLEASSFEFGFSEATVRVFA